MKRIASLLFCAAIIASLPSFAIAGPSRFEVGLQGGMFMPQNWPIQDQVESWTGGFGRAFELGGYCGYYINDFEIRIKSATRQSVTEKKLRNSYTNFQRNILQVVSFDLSFIYHMKLQNKNYRPYLGFGTGLNVANWKAESRDFLDQYYEGATILKGTTYPIGIHFLAGCEFPLNHNFYLSSEFGYSYISSDWKLEIADNIIRERANNISIGGASLRLGLGRRF